MLDLTFGEQVKIVLSRKGMTIKELAEIIEERTGKKMSRQNLTQRLGRDNFQEQDMRMIADILGCPFQLSILADINEVERASRIEDVKPTEKELSKLARAKERKEERKEKRVEKKEEKSAEKAEVKPVVQRYIVAGRAKEEAEAAREVTVGELTDIPEEPTTVYEEVVQEEVYEEPAYEEVYEEPVYEEIEEVQEDPVYEEAYEEPAEPAYEEAYEEPAYEETAAVQVEDSELADLLNEIDAIEKEYKQEAVKEAKQPIQEKQDDKKNRGWRAMFQRRSKKEEFTTLTEETMVEEPVAEAMAEESAEVVEETEEFFDEGAYEEEPVYYENDYIDYESMEVPEVEEEEIEEEEEQVIGEINPYTGREYESNSVRMHPKRIGYVQVYDRSDHQWTDMTEWAFLGYQERKKALLGKDYEPPVYLD